jgi:iron(III) transport system substrate-binding protein
VLSSAGQAVMTHHDPTDGDTYFIPVVNGVTNAVTRQYTGINFVDLNVSQWASVEAEYKQWFHGNIIL